MLRQNASAAESSSAATAHKIQTVGEVALAGGAQLVALDLSSVGPAECLDGHGLVEHCHHSLPMARQAAGAQEITAVVAEMICGMDASFSGAGKSHRLFPLDALH